MKKTLTALLTAASALLAALPAPAENVVIPDELKQRVETEGWSQQWHDELYSHEDPAVGAALRQMLRAKRDAAALASGLVVHEWGSMQHHLGTTTSEFDPIGEDQSDLPKFVNVWADQPVIQPQVIRKPILYFYTQEQLKVNVTVRFPKGVLTQWYPDVSFYSPMRDGRVRPGGNQAQMQNGTLAWHQLNLDPKTDTGKFANVDKDHPWWHTARDTDATPVHMPAQVGRGGKVKEAVERFLFYRGAGQYTPMVLPEQSEQGETFSVRVPFEQIDLRGVFLVRVNDSGATITHAPVLKGQSTLKLDGPDQTQPVEAAATTAKVQLIDSLEAAGLFPKEAAGLVKIWGDDMFTTPGDRLLYIMPNNEVERLLPLDIQPAPSQTVRTLIGWVELSTPAAEKRVMNLVKLLGSEKWVERKEADEELRKLDHFAEAILRRAMNTTEDAETRLRIEQILLELEHKRTQGKLPSAPIAPIAP